MPCLLDPPLGFNHSKEEQLEVWRRTGYINTGILCIDCFKSDSERTSPSLQHKLTVETQHVNDNCDLSSDLQGHRRVRFEEVNKGLEESFNGRKRIKFWKKQLANNDNKEVQGVSMITFFMASLRTCAQQKDLRRGIMIHADIQETGLLEIDIFLGTALINMYFKCGHLERAQEVFDKLSMRDAFSWSSLIAGYVEHGRGKHALKCYEQMKFDGISPNAVTFVCVLKACGIIKAVTEGQAIHAEILREGLLTENVIVANALVDMYAKCGLVVKAQEVFNVLPFRDLILWSTLLAGYSDAGLGQQALQCYEHMQFEGFLPDAVTFICILKACAKLGDAVKGQMVHDQIARAGSIRKDIVVGHALVSMYAKLGLLQKALNVLKELPVKDVVSYSALIAGYIDHKRYEEAFECSERMELEGVCPNGITYGCILKACGSTGAIQRGQIIHVDIMVKGFLEGDVLLGTSLVDMYCKCGMFVEAQKVLDELLVLDIASWNAMLTGYALFGNFEDGLFSFNKLLAEEIKPDSTTFTVLLNTCNHTGIIYGGQLCFEIMACYHILPDLEHYTCMADLFGRAGHFGRLMTVIEKMPFHPDSLLWHAMFNTCQKWGNIMLGRLIFENTVQLNEKDTTAYVCMSNIYADADD